MQILTVNHNADLITECSGP